MSEHEPHLQADQPENGEGQDSPEHNQPDPPRIWVGCLADYNNGQLTGEWLDAAVSDDELLDRARRVLQRSETPDAEEWAIFDYEGFGDWKVGEYEQLDVVAAVARGIAENGPAFGVWAELHDAEADMLEGFADAYLGEYDSAAAWAESMTEDLDIETTLDDLLLTSVRSYVSIDYAAMGRDAWLGGDIYIADKPGGGVWIFDARP